MEIEARLAALEHLVIAAIVAADAHSGRAIAPTLRVAEAFKDFAHRSDPPWTAEYLEALLQTLRAARSEVAPRGEPGQKVVTLHAATFGSMG